MSSPQPPTQPPEPSPTRKSGEPPVTAEQEELFPFNPDLRKPQAKVIILTGPSGSGKTFLASRVGLPSLSLDHFYRDADENGMPYLKPGLVDWDTPLSWNKDASFQALSQLCLEGKTDVPIYDIPTNRKTGSRPLNLGENPLFIAEGIFAAELVTDLHNAGLLAGAICIARSPLRNAWFRLLRDLGEARKPIPVLISRGAKLAREEPGKVRHWVEQGCEPLESITAAELYIRNIINRGP